MKLTRVPKKNFQQVSNFICDNLEKFKPKIAWKGRLLSDMALEGLQSGKWTAYAFYDDEKIVSYLDYKLRSDGQVELGIQLTDQNYQDCGLATGLINLFRLSFITNRLFAGTFEENAAMRHVLHKCQFENYNFFDCKTQLLTNKVRERIDSNDPKNKQAMTNSVYFFSPSLLGKFRLYEESMTS